MLHVFTRDDQRRQILVAITGPATVEDLLGLIDRQIAEKAWAYSMLYDLRAITYAPTQHEVERIITYVQRASAIHGRRGPVALVTAKPVNVGVGRMYSIRGEGAGLNVEVFDSMDKAEDWLTRQSATPASNLTEVLRAPADSPLGRPT